MTVEKRIRGICDEWFLTEPIFYSVYCSLQLRSNPKMECRIRSGERRIEYNPTMIKALSDNALKSTLYIEMIRIVLKHPYLRKPKGASPSAILAGSDCAISQYYTYLPGIHTPKEFNLPNGKSYEWYVRMIAEQQKQENTENTPAGKQQSTTGDGSDEQLTTEDEKASYVELWAQDETLQADISSLLNNSQMWGSSSASLKGIIKDAGKGRIDYRKVLSGFRASVLSERRKLTRMRPSRRFGFKQMGSVYDFTTQLLVAVDVSGSVSDEDISNFLHVIDRFFKYGITRCDVIQFDTDVNTQPEELKCVLKKKRLNSFEAIGRGGTNFQPVIDYATTHTNYDGLLIFTDGGAPTPTIPSSMRTKIVWVFYNEDDMYKHIDRLGQLGRICCIQ